jgi:hypothetical protein
MPSAFLRVCIELMTILSQNVQRLSQGFCQGHLRGYHFATVYVRLVPRRDLACLNISSTASTSTWYDFMADSLQDEAMSASTSGNPGTGMLKDDAALENAVSAAPKKKEPPLESTESFGIRSLVIFSFWAIVLFLGLPVWLRTTAIYRAKLPLNQMMDWADGRVREPSSFIALANGHPGVSTSISTSNIHRSGLPTTV